MTSTPPTPPIPPVQPTTYQQQTFVAPQPGRHRKSAKLSIAALVMGILALIPILGVLCALLGLIFGIVSLAKKRPKPGLAITGIVLSGLGLFVAPSITTAILLPYVNRARVTARRSVSMTRLSGISKSIQLYDAEHNQYPKELSQLVEKAYLGTSTLYYPGKRELGVAYFYLTPAKDAPAETIMACEKAGFDEEGRNVLFANGSIQWLLNDEFAKTLAKPANAKFAKALKRAEGP